jgi:hypothetical protein
MDLILSGGGSWLRRFTVRCSACHRLYRTLASVIATCPRCGAEGPWILDCRGPLVASHLKAGPRKTTNLRGPKIKPQPKP